MTAAAVAKGGGPAFAKHIAKAVNEQVAKQVAKTKTPAVTKAKAAEKAAEAKALMERLEAKATARTAAAKERLSTAGYPAPSSDRVERIKLAGAEQKALTAWTEGGEKGKRPPTPNIDAIDAKVKISKAKAPVKKATTTKPVASRVVTPKADTHPKIAAARKAAKEGARGKGKPITDEDLKAYIVGIRAEVPGVTRSQAQQINWWVDGYACGIARFNTAWDAITA